MLQCPVCHAPSVMQGSLILCPLGHAEAAPRYDRVLMMDRWYDQEVAAIALIGKVDTIAGHYAAAVQAGTLVLGGERLMVDLAPAFYIALWLCYFQVRPDLLAAARAFDIFADTYPGMAPSPAETVALLAKSGESVRFRPDVAAVLGIIDGMEHPHA